MMVFEVFFLIVIVSANSGVDITYELARFEVNKVNRAKREMAMIGGKAVNALRTLARLGIPAKIITFCDNNNLSFFETELGKLQCQYHIIPVGNPLRCCSIIVDSLHKTSTVINGPGPPITQSERALFLDSVLNALRADDNKYLVLCGSLPEGMPDGTYEELISMARKYHKYVLVDAAGYVLQKAVTASPNLVKVNKDEFAILVDVGQSIESTVKKYLKNIDNIIITLGGSGAVCYTGEKFYRVHPLSVDVQINPTGCGDAFMGGYLAGLVREYPVDKCLKLANAAAYANLIDLWPDIVNSLDKIEYFQQNTVICEEVGILSA